ALSRAEFSGALSEASFSGASFSGDSGAEAIGSAAEGCACSGASSTAEPPVWVSCAVVMVSRLESRLRAVLSSNKFIASVSSRVCARLNGTWSSGLLAWSLGYVEADLADDPGTIPAGSKPRPIRDSSTIATALEGCQTRKRPIPPNVLIPFTMAAAGLCPAGRTNASAPTQAPWLGGENLSAVLIP